MATYNEIQTLRTNSDLRNRCEVAIMIKAHALAIGSPTTAQITFAKAALKDPSQYVDAVFAYMLADNNGASIATITGATDAAIQTNTNNAVDQLLAV